MPRPLSQRLVALGASPCLTRACITITQATIYDNEHFGSYIQSVQQFVNAATENTPGGVRPEKGAASCTSAVISS